MGAKERDVRRGGKEREREVRMGSKKGELSTVFNCHRKYLIYQHCTHSISSTDIY